MSNSVPDMFWATNQMVQKMLISKDGQDGSLATRWNFAQNRVQGSNTNSSNKTEVIPIYTIINIDYATLGHHNPAPPHTHRSVLC